MTPYWAVTWGAYWGLCDWQWCTQPVEGEQ